jgi:hypothetical protein
MVQRDPRVRRKIAVQTSSGTRKASCYEGRCKATLKREFKLPWREAGPPNHLGDQVVSD